MLHTLVSLVEARWDIFLATSRSKVEENLLRYIVEVPFTSKLCVFYYKMFANSI